MEIARFRVTETYTTRVLGTAPADKKVYQEYIAVRKREAEESRRKFAERHGTPEPDAVGTALEEIETVNEEAGVTVFHNDLGQKDESGAEGKGIFFFNYQVMGYWKETAEILQEEHGVKQPRSKLDNFMFIEPRRVYITDAEGRVLQKPDGRLERPLRAMTMRGPRVSLACSDMVNPGRMATYTVGFLPYLKTGSGKEAKKLDLDRFVELIVSHGRIRGRSQWRNGGNGLFIGTVEALGPDGSPLVKK